MHSARGQRSPRGALPAPAPAPAPAVPPPPPPPEIAQVFRTCTNCGKDVLSANFLMHEIHCARHYKKCAHCGVLFETAALEAHIADARGTLPILVAALEAGDAARVATALDHGGAELLTWRDERGASLLHLVAAAARDDWAMHALVIALCVAGSGTLPEEVFAS